MAAAGLQARQDGAACTLELGHAWAARGHHERQRDGRCRPSRAQHMRMAHAAMEEGWATRRQSATRGRSGAELGAPASRLARAASTSARTPTASTKPATPRLFMAHRRNTPAVGRGRIVDVFTC